jgi:hypothetical protein
MTGCRVAVMAALGLGACSTDTTVVIGAGDGGDGGALVEAAAPAGACVYQELVTLTCGGAINQVIGWAQECSDGPCAWVEVQPATAAVGTCQRQTWRRGLTPITGPCAGSMNRVATPLADGGHASIANERSLVGVRLARRESVGMR